MRFGFPKKAILSGILFFYSVGCGEQFSDHYTWEDHVRDMVELEDAEHTFNTQVSKNTLIVNHLHNLVGLLNPTSPI